jgi:tRNA A37 threonylcarbamoyladenosine synthetase subunit TsaC/SUA5/YrdC
MPRPCHQDSDARPCPFIPPVTREVPRRLAHPKKRCRCTHPEPPLVKALLHELGEPLVSSTFLLAAAEGPMTDRWPIKEEVDQVLDAVVDAGECGQDLTTVVDWSELTPRWCGSGWGTRSGSSKPAVTHSVPTPHGAAAT